MVRDIKRDSGSKGKILHVLPIPILPFIGPSLRCLRQSRALKNNGWDVTIACLKIRGEKELERLEKPIFQGINVLPVIPNLPSPVLREIGTLMLLWPKLKDIIDDISPDIVHVHNPPDTMAFVTSIICSIKGIPLVYDIHDSSKEVISAAEFSPLLKKIYIKVALFFEKEIIKRTTGIVTVSESLKALLLNTRGIFKKCSPYFIVMRNVDNSLRSITEENRDDEQDYIFYSGTLYSKFIGLEFLIDSIENILRGGKARLFIAGDGVYKKVLERYIINKDLSASVKLLGYVQKDKVGSLIEGAKITVIPYERNSLTEIALPNKLFEYMSFGKPIVYPDFPGFREVLGTDNEGKYMPGDKGDIARVIENMLTNESLRKSVGDKNKILLKEITFEKEFSKLIGLYDKILSNGTLSGECI